MIASELKDIYYRPYCNVTKLFYLYNRKFLMEMTIGMSSLQLYTGFSSFETMSPAFRSGQSWRLKIFPLVLCLMINNYLKSSLYKISSIFDYIKSWDSYMTTGAQNLYVWSIAVLKLFNWNIF